MASSNEDTSCQTALLLFSNETQTVRATALCNCDDRDLFELDEVNWDISFDPYLVLYYSLLGTMGVMVLVSNLALVVGILRDKRIHQMHNLLVAGQGLSDLAVGLLVAVMNLGTLGTGGELIGREIGCDLYGFGIVTTCHSTLFSLCLIAYTRKVRILDNDNVSSRKAALLYVFGVWGGSLLVLSFYLLLTQSRMACSGSFCNPLWNEPVIVMSSVTIGCPILYTVSVYYRIHKRLEESRQALRGSMGNADGNDRYSHNKTTRLMVLMSGTILVMWIPLYVYFLFTIIKTLTGINFSGFWAVERLLGISAVASSLCSPLVYGFKNKTLKLAMLYAFSPMTWKDAAADRIKARAHLKYRQRSRMGEPTASSATLARRGSSSRPNAGRAPDSEASARRGVCCGLMRYVWTLAETRPATVVNESVFSTVSGSVAGGGPKQQQQQQRQKQRQQSSRPHEPHVPHAKKLPKLQSLVEQPSSTVSDIALDVADSVIEDSTFTFDVAEEEEEEAVAEEDAERAGDEKRDAHNEHNERNERNESSEDEDDDDDNEDLELDIL